MSRRRRRRRPQSVRPSRRASRRRRPSSVRPSRRPSKYYFLDMRKGNIFREVAQLDHRTVHVGLPK